MKVTIASQALLDGLNIAAGAVALRTPKAALQCVLIRACSDSVLLMATDLEVGIRYVLTQVEVEKEGEVLVSLARLSGIVRESRDETIALELVENTLHIRGSDSHFQVYTSDPSEFPPVPELEGKADFEVSGEELRWMIDRTLFAAAKESTRYAIDGLLWERKGKQLKIVATDGRRLSMVGCEVEKAGEAESKGIVPSKAVSLFHRAVLNPEEKFRIKFLSNQVLLAGSRVTISSVLVEGNFPKYEDVIPQDCDKKVRLDTLQLLSATRRASLLTSEESRAVRLEFTTDKLVMQARAPEQGEATIEMAVDYKGDPLEIGFNPVFLSDMLKVVDSDEVLLELRDSNRPGLFRNGERHLYVVMPVNLS